MMSIIRSTITAVLLSAFLCCFSLPLTAQTILIGTTAITINIDNSSEIDRLQSRIDALQSSSSTVCFAFDPVGNAVPCDTSFQEDEPLLAAGVSRNADVDSLGRDIVDNSFKLLFFILAGWAFKNKLKETQEFLRATLLVAGRSWLTLVGLALILAFVILVIWLLDDALRHPLISIILSVAGLGGFWECVRRKSRKSEKMAFIGSQDFCLIETRSHFCAC